MLEKTLSTSASAIIGDSDFTLLESSKKRAALIAKRTCELKSKMFSAHQLLNKEDFVPCPIEAAWRKSPPIFKFFQGKGLDSEYRLLTLLLLNDEQLFQLPSPSQNELLTQALLKIYQLQSHASIQVRFLLQPTPEAILLDNIIAANLGILLIPLPENIMDSRAWRTHEGNRPTSSNAVLKSFIAISTKILRVAQFGKATLRKPQRSLISCCIPSSIKNFFGMRTAPFARNDTTFFQAYAQSLLQYIEDTSPSPKTKVLEDEDALWKIVLANACLRGTAQIFYVDQGGARLFPSGTPFQKLPQLIARRVAHTIKDAIIHEQNRILPPTEKLQSLHYLWRELWWGTTSRHGASFVLIEQYNIIDALVELNEYSCLNYETNLKRGWTRLRCTCVPSDEPIFAVNQVGALLLVSFPTPEAMKSISSLLTYIQFAGSYIAMCSLLTNSKTDANIEQSFNEQCNDYILNQIYSLECSSESATCHEAYQRFAESLPNTVVTHFCEYFADSEAADIAFAPIMPTHSHLTHRALPETSPPDTSTNESVDN